MVSCAVGGGCNGGWSDAAIDYVADNSQTTESRYPYTDGSGSSTSACNTGVVSTNAAGNAVKLTSKTHYITRRSEAALMAAVDVAPAVFYYAVDSRFSSYGGGVYEASTCASQVNHAMLIVGYSSDDLGGYWIVKNSWGSGWGEGGYIRIAMTGDGDGPCGMYGYPMQPSTSFNWGQLA